MEKKPILDLKEISKTKSGDFTKIVCPSCGTAASASDLNINDKIAKCGQCDSVYSFQNAISPLLSFESPKQEVLRPEGIDVFYFKDEMDITLTQPITLVDAIVGPLMVFFAVLLTLSLFSKKMHWAVPAVMWGMSAYPLFNLIFHRRYKVNIVADKKHFSIIYKPRRYGQKNHHYDAQDIDQLYVRSKEGLYDLMLSVHTPHGIKQVPVIQRINGLSKARYLEQEIERYLGISDRPIPEEVK